MPNRLDLVGKKFGSLLVTKFGYMDGPHHRSRWVCMCDCGNETTALGTQLVSGKRTTCGCSRRGENHFNFKHGRSGTRAHNIWMHILDRCYLESMACYPDYGGRGISVCDEWRNSFATFFADMGDPPSKNHSIDRIDVNGNYSPENCRWATRKEQERNKRNNRIVVLDGNEMCLADAADILGMTYGAARARANRGTLPNQSSQATRSAQEDTK